MRRIYSLALVGALTTAACVGQIGDGGAPGRGPGGRRRRRRRGR